ncbi:hypothetical protein SMC26_27615 [Actinomadura fulvescens]
MPTRPSSTSVRVGAPAGALAVALALGGCSSDKPAATVTVTATPAPTADQIAAKARDAFAKVPNVRVRGKVKTEAGRITVDYSIQGKNSKGRLKGRLASKDDTNTEFVSIGDKHYTRSLGIGWTGPKPPAGLLKRLNKQWTMIRGKDTGLLGTLLTTTTMFGPTGQPLSFGPGRAFEGKPAHDLADGKGTHLWVSSQGEPLPIAVTNDKSPGDRLDFAYGQAEKIKAPANAVDISKQGSFRFP